MATNLLLNDAQLRAELNRCEFCEEKPCREACPVNCSPADFIMAARLQNKADYRRAAAEIMTANPLGGVCGLTCPDRFCQAACTHKLFDRPIEIPAVQATLIAKAKAEGVMPKLVPTGATTGKKVAVIGAGPAGIAAAGVLAQKGHTVTIFEREARVGGACNLIPEHRLPRDIIETDSRLVLDLPNVSVQLGTAVGDPASLLASFDAVCVAVGLWEPMRLPVPGADLAILGLEYLEDPGAYGLTGHVVVIGGGATAVDCAVTAKRNGAASVEMICLEKVSEMPLTRKEFNEVLDYGVTVTGRTRLASIRNEGGRIDGIITQRVGHPEAQPFNVRDVRDVPGATTERPDVDHVIIAIGARSGVKKVDTQGVFWAGDCAVGPSTVVEAAASGKNVALAIDAFLAKVEAPKVDGPRKSRVILDGYSKLPANLETDFFGRTLPNPFLLSAAPPSDGYRQMKIGLQAGWAGGVMKTAFDNVSIHIPADYMCAFDKASWGNCDNVSGHTLDRVCLEIEALLAEFPDRLIAASTGGPVTGNDANDKAGWQANTRKLEASGVHAIEYSLSCPQGGDGTEGAIVSQNARVTAKIIDWILEVGSPDVPKLFKLTAAVTSIEVIIRAIRDVLAKHPGKKAGVTLANTFPVMAFRPGHKPEWDEGIVFGMSGAGVLPISYLTLASVGNLGVPVSGNGGVMDHVGAANFLALGCGTVQICTAAEVHGYGYIDHLTSGLAHLMAERGIADMKGLIGRALPNPIRDFMDLTARKRISSGIIGRCTSCGNCTRCPYLAISLDDKKHPVIKADHCVGCSFCVQNCFAGALEMRERTEEELAVLRED
jgi:NADPH-dependent glutamate synthase beta subunit-like oxidoreductase/dihydroorotate dehydrogenase/NAD-dependent dihydropyrimidine dehydrogenase PreA subunit